MATEANRQFLTRLREGLDGLPVVVEFRNSRWLEGDTTFDLLRSLEMGFCCVDEPRLKGLMPPVSVATTPVAYVRFHGRNAQKWWRHDHAWERYDYTYSQDELMDWVPRIQSLAEDSEVVYLYANNHWEGQSVGTARQLGLLLGLGANGELVESSESGKKADTTRGDLWSEMSGEVSNST